MVPLHAPLKTHIKEALASHDELIAGLLARRGIETAKEAEAFLSPSYDEHIGDPMEILNMPKAAKRISDAIEKQERITVWSDYDCDGIPGGVLLHDFLKKAGANFSNYIPHRHEEGFGVNEIGLQKLAQEGTKVLITVDCGITDVEPIARAKELGMDVILTDHHLPGESLPDAFAIIDPKQKGETNSFKDFCGAGLAWKLACAVLAYGREHNVSWSERVGDGYEKWLLDMAGLATIADMVPLLGENRVIAKYGLIVMQKTPRIGFQKLCKSARVFQRSITEEDVGFMIAPRINAASRMGNPRDAFELFTTEDENRADELAKELERINRSRRAVAGSITRSAKEKVEERLLQGALPDVLVFGDPDWRPGLLGLVANTLSEEFERPVFLWGREGGHSLKGSCRAGVPGVSVVALMDSVADAFVGYGGHSASGGFTVKDEEVFTLEQKLCEAFRALPERAQDAFIARADATISLSEATHTLLSKVSRLSPFGMANEKPIFGFTDVSLTQVAWFGKNEEHIKLTISDGAFASIEAISFYAKRTLGKNTEKLMPGARVSILGSLERDQFSKGRPLRLRLVSVRSA